MPGAARLPLRQADVHLPFGARPHRTASRGQAASSAVGAGSAIEAARSSAACTMFPTRLNTEAGSGSREWIVRTISPVTVGHTCLNSTGALVVVGGLWV